MSSREDLDRSPFHAGESAVQEQAGVRDLAERGRPGIRRAMPAQHQDLFEVLPYLVVGTLDPEGRPFATMLSGVPGFVDSPDPSTLSIDAWPVSGDPVARGLVAGAPIGLLGIQLETRRRNRANGTVREAGAGRFVVDVEQSFGNCPKYIQVRTIEGAIRRPGGARAETSSLSPRALEVLARADTSFLSSASRDLARDGVHGCDVSHRGGKPGFLRAREEQGRTVVTLPDFSGNNFFMTLGNLAARPEVGLAVVDFSTGDLLSVTGTSSIVWEGEEVRRFAGAERLLRIEVSSGVLLEGAIPFVWSEPEQARQLAATGSW